jgi:hypothetical protein
LAIGGVSESNESGPVPLSARLREFTRLDRDGDHLIDAAEAGNAKP